MFNEQEMELLISGLPDVDIDDLAANTDYRSYNKNSKGVSSPRKFQELTYSFSDPVVLACSSISRTRRQGQVLAVCYRHKQGWFYALECIHWTKHLRFLWTGSPLWREWMVCRSSLFTWTAEEAIDCQLLTLGIHSSSGSVMKWGCLQLQSAGSSSVWFVWEAERVSPSGYSRVHRRLRFCLIPVTVHSPSLSLSHH